jgi:hypothetical protein
MQIIVNPIAWCIDAIAKSWGITICLIQAADQTITFTSFVVIISHRN